MSSNDLRIVPGEAAIAESDSGVPIDVAVLSGALEVPGCIALGSKPGKLSFPYSPVLAFAATNTVQLKLDISQRQKDSWSWTVPFPCSELKALFINIVSIAQAGIVPWVGVIGRATSGRKTVLYTLAAWLTKAGVNVIVADYDLMGTAVGYPGTVSAANFLPGETPGSALCLWGVCSFCSSRKATNYLTTMIQDRVAAMLTDFSVRGLDKPVVVIYRLPAYKNTAEGRKQIKEYINQVWSFLGHRTYDYAVPEANNSGSTTAHFNRFTTTLTDELSHMNYRAVLDVMGKFLPVFVSTQSTVQLGPITIPLPPDSTKWKGPQIPAPMVDLRIDPLLQDVASVTLSQRRRIHDYFYGPNNMLSPMVRRFIYTSKAEKSFVNPTGDEKHEFCTLYQITPEDTSAFVRILTEADFTGTMPMNLKERVAYLMRFHDEVQGEEILEAIKEDRLTSFFESEEGAIALLNANVVGLVVIKDFEVLDDQLYVEVLMPTTVVTAEMMLLALTEYYAAGSI